MKRKAVTLGVVFVLFLTIATAMVSVGCGPIEKTAADSIAVSYGLITYGQSEYKTSCVANPKQTVCILINRVIPLNNAAIDALEAYCGGPAPTGQAAFSAGGPCVPVKGLVGGLQAAIAALTPVLNDLKPLIHVTTPVKVSIENPYRQLESAKQEATWAF